VRETDPKQNGGEKFIKLAIAGHFTGRHGLGGSLESSVEVSDVSHFRQAYRPILVGGFRRMLFLTSLWPFCIIVSHITSYVEVVGLQKGR
jgi:hypothetical protein